MATRRKNPKVRPLDQATLAGQTVEVYRNLHNGLFSVRDARTRRVLGHTRKIVLTGVTFKVSQAGRERVLREQQKNVHAVVQGTLSMLSPPSPERGIAVTYNPYRFASFVRKDDHSPVEAASCVVLEVIEGRAHMWVQPCEATPFQGCDSDKIRHNLDSIARDMGRKFLL